MRKVLLSIVFFSIVSLTLFAVENPTLYFDKYDNSSKVILDHSTFAKLLSTYLDTKHPSGINRFDYKRVSSEDIDQLKSYISYLSKVKVTSLNKNEQMAYWINMYNALTIKVILDNYPVDSIRKISSGLFSPGPWKLKLITVEGFNLTLNQIEHEILRPIWKDKRIHYAVNCANIGYPNLLITPFTGTNVNNQLDFAAKTYIQHPRGLTIDGNTLRLSSIYKWYKEDFGIKQDLLKHLAEYSADSKKESILNWKGSIKYSYDWNLNEL